MATIYQGYWEPHTASIEFCEPNYFVTKFVAEFHNSWSSLVISILGIIGLLYANSTHEWRFVSMFGIMVVVGLGSFLLHATLHWMTQSCDEVPMLWQALSIIYALQEMKSPTSSKSYTVLICYILFGTIQTFIYYKYQNLYYMFLASYVALVAVIIFWSAYYITDSPKAHIRSIRWMLWSRAQIWYVLFGSVLWIYEMNYCPTLLPYYLNSGTGGANFHILWHIGAGMGTYHVIVFCSIVRIDALGYDATVKWLMGGILPYTCVGERKKIE